MVQKPLPREIWDLDMRLRDMDANDVDVQVLSTVVFTFYYGQEAALTQACAAIQNEQIAAVVRQKPEAVSWARYGPNASAGDGG